MVILWCSGVLDVCQAIKLSRDAFGRLVGMPNTDVSSKQGKSSSTSGRAHKASDIQEQKAKRGERKKKRKEESVGLRSDKPYDRTTNWDYRDGQMTEVGGNAVDCGQWSR